MKRLMTALLALLLTFPALAKGEERATVSLYGIRISFGLPENTLLLTPDSGIADFMAAGYMAHEMKPYMEENDILAILVRPEEPEWSISLEAYPYDGFDLDAAPERRLQLLTKEFAALYQEAGNVVDQVRVHQSLWHSWILTDYHSSWEDGSCGYGREYYTCQLEHDVWLCAWSWDAPLKDDVLAMLDAMADSLRCEDTQQ